jgi:hypothetical protein
MKYKWKLKTEKETYYTEAVDKEKALTSFRRKRNKYIDSYASIGRGKLTNLGLTETSKAEGSDLVKRLKESTVMLKEEYLERTKEYAIEYYDKYGPYANYTTKKWYDEFGETYNETRRGRSYSGTRLSPKGEHLRDASSVLRGKTVEEHIAKEIKRATAHYENSMVKLALRISDKGLNEDSLEIVTARVGVNIETTISDGEKFVRAWTIIASGPIQRPHYRYLVK